MNYKKTGYSVPEAAQIFRVIPQTVRNWINQGKLSARIDGKVQPGKKRHIRIEREHIQEYLSQHRGDYDVELLRAFDVDVVDPSEIPDEVKAYYKPCGDPELDSLPHTLDECTGAFAGMLESEEKVEQEYHQAMQGIKTYAEQKTETPKPVACQVLVDGRISVANVTKETAVGILTLLLNDPVTSISDISIRVQKEG